MTACAPGLDRVRRALVGWKVRVTLPERYVNQAIQRALLRGG